MRSATAVKAIAALALLVGMSAAQVKYVAVVETDMDAQSGAAAKLNKAEVREITAEIRRQAVKNLQPRSKYNIMTSETVQSMSGAVLEECAEENCVIALGSRIGADYIVRGNINKFGAKLTLSVEMYETENGMLVASSDPVRSEKTDELLEKTAIACAGMFKTFVNEMRGAQKAGTPQQTETPMPPPQPPPPQPVAAAPTQTYQPPVPTSTQAPRPTGGSWLAAAPTQTYQPPAPTSTPTPTPTPTYPKSVVDVSGVLTDSRDRKKYNTVVIGGKRWMAENLNFQPSSGSWCYNNDNSNCDKYGRLYNWNMARTVCPSGWHLPSRQEWNDLEKAAGGNKAGKKLKAKSGWNNNGSGTDNYGWSAIPGGNLFSGRHFYNVGYNSYWWTDTEGYGGSAYGRYMDYSSDYVYEYDGGKGSAFSVRCVAD